MMVGDSETAGAAGLVPQACIAISTAAFPVVSLSIAVPGQSSADFFWNANAILREAAPKVQCIVTQAWTRNDPWTITAPHTAYANARALAKTAIALGVPTILAIAAPCL